ncbi:hypothetical protein DYB30_002653, partial [Aphanomyces astaci]
HEFKVFRTHRREALLKVRTTPTAPSLVPVTQQVQGVAKAAAPVTQPKPTTTTVHNIRAYPKTELSDDDSSDDDDKQPPAKVQKTLAVPPPVVAKKKAAAIAPSQPKTALSSDSSDEESDVEVNQPPPVVKAAPLGAKNAPAVDLSSEDESDFSDEKPIILPAKTSAAALSSSDEDEGQVRVKPAPVKAVAPQTADSSDEDSSDEEGGTHVVATGGTKAAAAVPTADSAHSLVKKIEAYAASTNVDVLHLSPSLNSYERLLAHDCAERLGLSHESVGQGLDRHITVGRGGATKKKSWSKTRA